MFSRFLALPFIIIALVFLYLTWEVNEGYSTYIIAPVIILGLIYVFSPQINWWWYKRNPPRLDGMVEMLISKYNPFYQSLSPAYKTKFKNRVSLFTLAKEFMPQGLESVPTDSKGLIAASAVWVGFGKEDFLFPKFEKIILYPHPFPTPQYPENFHLSETYEKDGVVLFSIEDFMKSFINPKGYFHLGLYEFSKVFIYSFPHLPYPSVDDSLWDQLSEISGFKHDQLVQWIGLPELEPLPAAMVHFLTFPRKFNEKLPQMYRQFCQILEFDPFTLT